MYLKCEPKTRDWQASNSSGVLDADSEPLIDEYRAYFYIMEAPRPDNLAEDIELVDVPL
jgi:hypothetical protein